MEGVPVPGGRGRERRIVITLARLWDSLAPETQAHWLVMEYVDGTTLAQVVRKGGHLSPDEIHKLAHKGKKAVCHSDIVKDADTAKVVQINTLKAHGVKVNDGVL